MPLRDLKLPEDLVPLSGMIADTFQYPENEEWSMQSDELDSLEQSMKSLSGIWPIIRLLQFFSPSMRDLMRGFVWEEEGEIVGFTTTQRMGSTDSWVITGVGVLPEYRKHGIARQLVESVLSLIRDHGGSTVLLDVIDGNLPAYKLYESLGFEHYGGSSDYLFTPEELPPAPVLPDGYLQETLGAYDWQPRYELAKRTTPQEYKRYEAVEVDRYKRSSFTRLLRPVVLYAQGERIEQFLVRRQSDEQIAARGNIRITTRASGTNNLDAWLDPVLPELAPYLVQFTLYRAASASLEHRIEFSVPAWMPAVAQAVKSVGFSKRVEYLSMGLRL